MTLGDDLLLPDVWPLMCQQLRDAIAARMEAALNVSYILPGLLRACPDNWNVQERQQVELFLQHNSSRAVNRHATCDLGILHRHRPVDGNQNFTDKWEYCLACSQLNGIGYPFPCIELQSLARRYLVPIPAEKLAQWNQVMADMGQL